MGLTMATTTIASENSLKCRGEGRTGGTTYGQALRQ